MNKNYILALDEGTTSLRTLVYDVAEQKLKASANVPFEQIYPKPGWVEHNATEIWEAQLTTIKEATKDIGIDNVAAIGITNQRETVVAWDSTTGKPLYNAIVWQCRRTAKMCEALEKDGLSDMIKRKTGLVIDPYFTATKIKWLLDNVPEVSECHKRGNLMVGTMDTWLIYKLTGGKVFVTDYSNASRTMLFNINTLEWDREILDVLGIDEKILPQAVSSVGIVGYTDEKTVGARIAISGIGGDQQCALFGQNCFDVGNAKNTYGTGCFILMNTGEKPVYSQNGLLTTVAWGMDGKVTYALEGSVYNAGSVIKWLRDELKMITTAAETDSIVYEVEDNGGVYLVPAFTGLGAPFWDSYARGTVIGMTRGTTREHFVRAAVESLAFQCKCVFDAMAEDAGMPITELKADGGVSVCDFLLGLQADLLDIPVMRPNVTESTGLGAIYMAGLGAGIWKNTDEIKQNWKLERKFEPSDRKELSNKEYKNWLRAVKRASNWIEE